MVLNQQVNDQGTKAMPLQHRVKELVKDAQLRDPRVLPMGTKVYIEGVGERIVEDTGSAIKGHKIDVFIEDLDQALEFGRKSNIRVK